VRRYPSGAVVACSATLTISCDAAEWAYETSLDGGPWTLGPRFRASRGANGGTRVLGLAQSNVVVPHAVTGLSAGSHTISVRTLDSKGVHDSTPFTTRWEVVAPTAKVAFGPTNANAPTASNANNNANSALQRFDPHGHVPLSVSSDGSKFAFEVSVEGHPWKLGDPYREIDGAGSSTSSASAVHDDTIPPPASRYQHITGHTVGPGHALTHVGALSEGRHSLRVRAFDECGNVGPITEPHIAWVSAWASTIVASAAPRGVTKKSGVSVAVSSDVSPYQIHYRLDGAPWLAAGPNARLPAASRVTLTNLTEGKHTLEVRAADGRGRAGVDSAMFEWEVDTTPPVALIDPESLPSTMKHDTIAHVRWACLDAHTCPRFKYRLDGGPYVVVDGEGIGLGRLQPGHHDLSVLAIDEAGNEQVPPGTVHAFEVLEPSTQGAGVPAALPPPPRATVARGPEKYTADRRGVFDFAVSGTGWSSAPKLYYSLDGGKYVELLGTHLNLPLMEEGEHTLRAYAAARFVDGSNGGSAGNTHWVTGEDHPCVYLWTIDTVPPVTHLTHSSSATQAGSPSRGLGHRAAAAMPWNTATFTVTASPGPGESARMLVWEYEWRVNHGPWNSGTKQTRSGGGFEFRVDGLVEGTHLIEARTVDRAGNAGKPAMLQHNVAMPGGGGGMAKNADASSSASGAASPVVGASGAAAAAADALRRKTAGVSAQPVQNGGGLGSRTASRSTGMGARTMGGGRFDVGKSAEAAMAASASLGAYGRKAAFQMPTRSNGSSGDELR